MDNSIQGLRSANGRRDLTPHRSDSSCAALLKALQQLGLVHEEFNILPPPYSPATADPGRPPL